MSCRFRQKAVTYPSYGVIRCERERTAKTHRSNTWTTAGVMPANDPVKPVDAIEGRSEVKEKPNLGTARTRQ